MKILGLVALYIIWGSTYLANRFSLETMPPFTLGTTRFFLAGIILLVIGLLKKENKLSAPQYKMAFITGFLLVALGNGLIVYAQQKISSSLASLWIATTPAWLLMMNFIFFERKKPAISALIGCAAALIGIGFLVDINMEHFYDGSMVYQLCLMGAPMSWTIGTLIVRKINVADRILTFTGWQMLFGSLFYILFSLAFHEYRTFDVNLVSTKSIVALLHLVIFGSVIGYSVFAWLINVMPPHIVLTYAFVNPLVAVLLGVFWAQEPFTHGMLIAIPLIVGGVALILFGPLILAKNREYSTKR